MNLIDATANVKSQIMAPGGPFEIVDKQVNGQIFKVYANAPINLSQVVNDSRRTDDQTFLVYQEQRLTFKEFFEQVDSMATWMHAQKITQGDRVVIAMRNRPEWIIAFCAAALIGAVPAPLNSFGTGQELREAIAIIEPKLIVCDSTRWLRINEKTSWSGKTILLNDLQVDVN
ncbi:MAG: AMP-binding protein, partial [Glaciecola sp.]|nr:AMP-binding protein [Glaciecola sp.]